MSLWTIELIRTEVGPQPLILSGRRETWLWRAYEGAEDLSVDVREEMYKEGDYLVGVVSGRVTPRLDALKDAKAACEVYDLKRGQEIHEVIGYNPGLT